MSEEVYKPHRHYREGIFSAVSAGFFFILIGTIFITRPLLYDGLQNLFNSTAWANATVGNTAITVPVPANPGVHTEVYYAALEFCLVWAVFQVLILAFRFIGDSPRRRKARTISSAVFWFGAAYLINSNLNATATRNDWFIFWAAIVVLIGVTLIVRAIALALLK